MAAPDDGTAVLPPIRPAAPLRTADALIDAGLAPAAERDVLRAVAARYAVAIPPTIAGALAQESRDGPLARQFVPSALELAFAAYESADPTGDTTKSPVPGIVHRYPDRVLLIPTLTCAVYCRFCFRRESVGQEGGGIPDAKLEQAFAYIAGSPEIWEVIVTGGDPLTLSPRRLTEIVEKLSAIPHVAVIRVHSRVPVATPERLKEDHVAALALGIRRRRAVYVALHCNHADELGEGARAAIARIVDAGIPMLAQTVLLAGVNDDVKSLERLFRSLVAQRVKPYYLHHLDLAPGTARFRVPIEKGQALMRALRGRLSGHALPEYVLDIPGGFGKVPIGPVYAKSRAGRLAVTDPWGGRHDHPD